jgi:hypothetical protein
MPLEARHGLSAPQAAVEDIQLSSAMTAPEKARKQKLATPDRALDGTDAHPVGDQALIPRKLVRAYITSITFLEKNVISLRRTSRSAPDSLAGRRHADPAAGAAEHVPRQARRTRCLQGSAQPPGTARPLRPARPL